MVGVLSFRGDGRHSGGYTAAQSTQDAAPLVRVDVAGVQHEEDLRDHAKGAGVRSQQIPVGSVDEGASVILFHATGGGSEGDPCPSVLSSNSGQSFNATVHEPSEPPILLRYSDLKTAATVSSGAAQVLLAPQHSLVAHQAGVLLMKPAVAERIRVEAPAPSCRIATPVSSVFFGEGGTWQLVGEGRAAIGAGGNADGIILFLPSTLPGGSGAACGG
jgi:hypothetical protein